MGLDGQETDMFFFRQTVGGSKRGHTEKVVGEAEEGHVGKENVGQVSLNGTLK